MFIVSTNSPIDNEWLAREEEIEQAAGRISDGAGSDFETRDHMWEVDSFEEAMDMKKRLDQIKGVRVSVREK